MSSRRKRRLPSGCAGVAQLVEHRFCKPGAAGSSPASGFSRLSVRATGYPRSMEHPKDVGDRSALAVMLALRGAGYQIAVPFGENTRYDLVADDGVGLHRVQCKTGRLRNGSVRFMTASSYAHHSITEGTFATLPWADRLLRRVLPRHWRCLPSPYRARADVSQGNASSRARTS